MQASRSSRTAILSLAAVGVLAVLAGCRQATTGSATATAATDSDAAVSASSASAVSISASAANAAALGPLQAVMLTATGGNDHDAGVTWSLPKGAPGTVTSVTPYTAAYTAPPSVTTSGSYQVTVTSVADHTKTASVTVTLAPAPVPAYLQPLLPPGAAPYWQNLVQYENGLARNAPKPYDLLLQEGTPQTCDYTISTAATGAVGCQWQPDILIFNDTQTGTEIWRLSNDPSNTYIPGVVNRTPWTADGSYIMLGSTRNPTQNKYGSSADWLYDARGGLQVQVSPFDPNRQPSWTQPQLSLGNGYLPFDQKNPDIVYAVTSNDNNGGQWTDTHAFLYAIDLDPNPAGRRFQATVVASLPDIVDPLTDIHSVSVRKEMHPNITSDDRILVNDVDPPTAPAADDPGGYPYYYLYDGSNVAAVIAANMNMDPSQPLPASLTLLNHFTTAFNLDTAAFDVCQPGQLNTAEGGNANCHDPAQEWHTHDFLFTRDGTDQLRLNFGPRGSVGEGVQFLVPSTYNGDKSTITLTWPNGDLPYMSHPGFSPDGTAVVYGGQDYNDSNKFGLWERNLVTNTVVREYGGLLPFASGHADWSGEDQHYFVFDGWFNRDTGAGGYNLFEGLSDPTANFPSSGKGYRVLLYYPLRDPHNTVSLLYSPTQSPDSTKEMVTIPDSWDPAAKANLSSYVVVSHTPIAPTLSVTGTSPVSLSWVPYTPHREVAGYHVYRSSSPASGYTEVSPALIPVGTTTYTDTTAKAGTTYYYGVTAEERSGLESTELSNVMQAVAGGAYDQAASAGTTKFDTTPPDPPTQLGVTSVGDNVWKLTWVGSDSADTRYYNIYVSFGSAPQATQAYRVDSPPLGQTAYVYWQGDPNVAPVFGLTTMDRHGNESAMACMAAISTSQACDAH